MLRRALRPSIYDSINGHPQPSLCAEADGGGRCRPNEMPPPKRDELYETAVREFGRALDRLAAGYEADPERRHDLRQDIHLQLWRSFAVFDGRCSLKTWTFRVAHNTAVS
jgi:hypothetical protein